MDHMAYWQRAAPVGWEHCQIHVCRQERSRGRLEAVHKSLCTAWQLIGLHGMMATSDSCIVARQEWPSPQRFGDMWLDELTHHVSQRCRVVVVVLCYTCT